MALEKCITGEAFVAELTDVESRETTDQHTTQPI